MDQLIHTAYTIALINLRNSYRKEGIYAGRRHFSDMWTRDSLFACLGALSVQDFHIVKKNLLTLLHYMKEDGQIPLRIGEKYFLLKYIGIKLPNKVRYMEDKEISIPCDGNSLFIIAFEEYLSKTNDTPFAKYQFENLKKIMDWNLSQDKDQDLLMEETGYAGWADSLNKKGKVLYTNALHYKALESFSHICGILKHDDLEKHYRDLADQVRETINQYFWEKHYYVDQINRKKRYIFSTDGNLLAILFGIADSKQAGLILETIQDFQLNTSFCIQTNYPKYTPYEIYPPFLVIHMEDYHNGLIWLWLGCLHAVVIFRLGMKKEAKEILLKLAQKIIDFKGVYEVYDKGKPVRRFFYKSEQGFAWTSGLFVWACKQMGLDK